MNRASDESARSSLALGLLLAAVAVGVYGNTLLNGFVWDDRIIVVGDVADRGLGRLGPALVSPDQISPYYRPLTRALFVLEWALWGPQAAAFHALSLALHALNVFLLYIFSRGLFGSTPPSAAAALLLAIHPVHSEPVNFITARNNVLALTFMLAAAIVFQRGVRREIPALAWVAAGALFLGLAAKEPAIGVVPVLFSILLAEKGTDSTLRLGRLATWFGPSCAAIAAYLALRAWALGALIGAPSGGGGLGERALSSLAIVPRYLGLVAWPQELTVTHSAPVPSDALAPASLLAWSALGAIVLLVIVRPTVASAVGLVWFAAGLVPIVNLVPIPSAPFAERYVYIAAVGIWIVLADILRRISGTERRGRALATALLVVCVLLGARTVARNRDWRSDLTLHASAVRADPRSAAARFNLGTALQESGDLEGAVGEWQAAVALDPAHAQALTQLGTAAAASGRLGEAEEFWGRALAASPELPMAHFNMGTLKEKTGRPDEARRHYEAFLKYVRPEYRSMVPEAERRLRALRAEGG